MLSPLGDSILPLSRSRGRMNGRENGTNWCQLKLSPIGDKLPLSLACVGETFKVRTIVRTFLVFPRARGRQIGPAQLCGTDRKSRTRDRLGVAAWCPIVHHRLAKAKTCAQLCTGSGGKTRDRLAEGPAGEGGGGTPREIERATIEE